MVPVRLVELHVYPVKSARGISLARAEVGGRGLAHDRSFMVVDPAGDFLTQRVLPRMALIAMAIDGRALRLDAPGMATLVVPLAPERGAPRRAQVWGDECRAITVGTDAARWLTRFLGRDCELVYLPATSLR